MKYDISHIFGSSTWLIEPKALKALIKRAEMATPDAIQAALAAQAQRDRTAPRMFGDVAVIDMCGPITYRDTWFSAYFGGATIETMQVQLRAALADPAVRMIVFRCDSPGGSVEMVPEFADEVFAARGQKPLIAIADTMICSAAEWIAAQTNMTYVSATSCIGSIGVYTMHWDVSDWLAKAGIKITYIAHGDHKVDGNDSEPLSDDVRATIQASVDEIGAMFDAAMARGRGVTTKAVLDTFGQGLTFSGKKAIGIGLADKMGTFNQVMTKLTKGRVAVSAVARAGAVTAAPAVAELIDPAPLKAKKADDDEDDDTGCGTCSDECPCEEDECPADCPTCDDDCACKAEKQSKASAAQASADAEAAANDEAALLALL